MMKLVWSRPALEDLQAIVDYISRDSQSYADDVAARIIHAVERLMEFPWSGRSVPEARRRTIREVLVSSYRAVYRVKGAEIQVLAILHAAQDPRRMRPRPWTRG